MMKVLELNTFHMHLSDDQGWRLEIPELPELTTFGANRCYGNFTDNITNDFPCLWPEPQGKRFPRELRLYKSTDPWQSGEP